MFELATGPEAKEVIGWLVNALTGVLVFVILLMRREISQARKDGIDKAIEIGVALRERQDLDRTAAVTRDLQAQKHFDDIWTAIKTVEDRNRETTNQIYGRLDGMAERLGQIPTREEIRTDRAEMERRITDAVRAQHPHT